MLKEGSMVRFKPTKEIFEQISADGYLGKYYPKPGTIGVVTGMCDAHKTRKSPQNPKNALIKWEEGSTMANCEWFCNIDFLEEVRV